MSQAGQTQRSVHDPRDDQSLPAEDSAPRPQPHEGSDPLLAAAMQEQSRSSRSRLAPFAQVIAVLRAKQWSFAAITAWLEHHGVRVAESTLQRFYRAHLRGESGQLPQPPAERGSIHSLDDSIHEEHQSPTTSASSRSINRPKYNTDF